MTRDDAKWWVGIVGGAAVGVAGNLHLFPWIPEPWQHGIGIAAFIYGIVAGKMATSPLPGNMTNTMSEAAPHVVKPPPLPPAA